MDLCGVLVVGVRAEEQVAVGEFEGLQAHQELVQGDPWMGFTELGVKTGHPCQGDLVNVLCGCHLRGSVSFKDWNALVAGVVREAR